MNRIYLNLIKKLIDYKLLSILIILRCDRCILLSSLQSPSTFDYVTSGGDETLARPMC